MATNGAEGAKPVINGKQSLAGAVLPAEEVVIPGIGKRASETALINGDTHITGLGAYPTPNGVSPSSPTKAVLPDSMYDLPEEIMHITADRHSLGALIQRVSGECFNSLEELVDELSRIPIQLPPPLVNGASNIQHPPTLDQAQQRDNMRKKKKMLEFASEYRAKFIKLLVVTDWTKRDDKVVGKLIDLKNWLMEQDDAAPFAGNFFAATVMDLRSFKITNPDLETALAVLSGGDVPWIPHFGYRKQKTLTAGEVLKVLRQMNTIINMRLVLHEELIPQMRDYRVADGRATFTFPQEFELDVYVASGDPGKPWFFLDLRFLFEPAPQMTGAGIREVMDRQVNAALLRGGLREACDLVHNFTLTHKLGILRKQAQDLQRGVWASALGVELVRRTLTVHYWVESPQSKSWIEIGIHTGKDRQRRKKVDNAISSQIRARWIRNHDEQKGVEVPINLGALSIERVLSAHIARHSSYILEKVRDALKEIGPNVGRLEENPLKLSLTTSDTEPADCSLRAQIGEHPATTLQIDGITGRMYFSPAGSASTNAQVALERSKDPISDAPGYFARYLTYEIQVRLDQLIENGNWDAKPNINVSKEEVCRRTKQDVHRFAFFQSRGFGGVNWFLMYTIDLSGEQWWLFEINQPPYAIPPTCTRLKVRDANDRPFPLSMQLLKRLEQSAVSAMSYSLANRELTANGVSTAMRYLPIEEDAFSSTSMNSQPSFPPKNGPSSSTIRAAAPSFLDTPSDVMVRKTLPSLMVRFSQLLKSKSDRFANELLQLQYLSFDTDAGQVRLVAKGRMRNPAKVQDILQRTKDNDVAFSVDGSFSMVIETGAGSSFVSKVVARLTTLSTLCNFARILKERGFECRDISFNKVCFKYAEGQEVTLVFGGTEKEPRIKLEIKPENPHRKVAPLLEEILNDPELGFERFTMALGYFLPVLRAFQTLDSKHALDIPDAPNVHPRQVDFYRLAYPNPTNPKDPYVTFDLNFKRNKDDLEWRVSEVSSPAAREEREKVFPGFNMRLLQFMKRVGTGWTGMSSLLVADKGGIEDAILELDRCVWSAMQELRQQNPTNNGTAQGSAGHEVITID